MLVHAAGCATKRTSVFTGLTLQQKLASRDRGKCAGSKLPRLGGSPTHVHSPSPPSTMIFSRPFSLGPLVRHWPYLWQKTRLFLEYRASRRSGVRHGAAMMSGYVSGRVEDKGEGKGPTAERQAVSEASKASRQESKPSNVSQESAQR